MKDTGMALHTYRPYKLHPSEYQHVYKSLVVIWYGAMVCSLNNTQNVYFTDLTTFDYSPCTKRLLKNTQNLVVYIHCNLDTHIDIHLMLTTFFGGKKRV